MTHEESYTQENVLKILSSNLKKLMTEKDMNQKQFAQKMEISEPTLSGYMKALKPPSLSFLASLKKHFPDILLDDILFSDLELPKEPTESLPDSVSNAEYLKYKGTYFLYYLDTSKKPNSKLASESVHEAIDLKLGILYVSSKSVSKSTSATRCIAVFGIRMLEEVQKLKADIDLLDDYTRILDYLRDTRPHGLYLGQLYMSQMHIFITLDKAIDGKDHALVILHHASINKDYYSGGIGTINSVSTGRTSEPIVQLIALSKKRAYLSDEQIKSKLRFSTPDIHVKGCPESVEILKLAKSIYCRSDAPLNNTTPYDQFSEQNIEILLTSYMEYLISKNLENHQLWCGRVSTEDDDDWYHLLKESETYHENHQKGATHENAEFEAGTDYLLH